jgi:hypothetical protein
MVFIYALVCEELVLYVGRTIHAKRREQTHRRRLTACGSSDIPIDMDWEMIILDDVFIDEGVAREQYYYDILKPWYNRYRPGQTKKESDSANREQRNANCKAWMAANREHRNAYRRARYAAKKSLIL